MKRPEERVESVGNSLFIHTHRYVYACMYECLCFLLQIRHDIRHRPECFVVVVLVVISRGHRNALDDLDRRRSMYRATSVKGRHDID